MTDPKSRVKAAMLKHHQKILEPRTNIKPARQNKKPEKDTEKDVLIWARTKNIFLHVVDSSSFNPLTGCKSVQKAETGFPDLVGNHVTGLCLYIELKAKQRRSTVSEAQREFLSQKIQQNCFAVVVDSAERLDQYWLGFWQQKSLQEKQNYLLDCLPKKRAKTDEPLF